MAPIRVGILGLSASSWAKNAHLPYLLQSPNHTVAALCNSSVEAAKKAVASLSLPPETKTYGSPADLAADPDIDLVVCSVRVDRHYETIKPAIEAGKTCFVEWPLASSYDQAKELLELSKKSGSKVMVGLQGQTTPVVRKLKQVIESGRIGRLLSVHASSEGLIGGPTMSEGVSYAVDKKVGGNMLTIAGGHFFDSLLYAVGELASLNATMSIQHPKVNLLDPQGKTVKTVERDTYDHISLQGKLAGSGASFAATLGGSSPLKGQPGQTWRIAGDKAVIEVSVPSFLQLSSGTTMTLRDWGSDEGESVDVSDPTDLIDKLPYPAIPVGNLYDAFAKDGKGEYPDWEWAVRRHALLQAMVDSEQNGERTSYTAV
ncbi:hypothetical protein FH972_022343 [Carpinus fangiana]|uniref:Gfo/Idh/MocA-like oxidoreductase N-terminal domain-containing protein n=1 Tax=Carpinus fangiana TaxID=176857 RepID=A0A5N6KSI9_9ROSI|nr:hypothetical protein FH972_022343 [Carpinus fangiana]